MGTKKLRAIWSIIRSNQVMLFTDKKDGIDVYGFGVTDSLKDIIIMAVELKKAYNNLVKMVDAGAAELGELHAVREFKEALEEIADGRK